MTTNDVLGFEIAGVNREGEEVDASVLEEQNIAFDPTKMHLDLTKSEKRRTTALMLAIQAYEHLIVKDAQMYTAIIAGGKQLHPASIDGMVIAAMKFDLFISGNVPEHSLITATGSEDRTAEPAQGEEEPAPKKQRGRPRR